MSNIFKSLKSVTITRDHALLHCQSPIEEYEAPSRIVKYKIGCDQSGATILNDIEAWINGKLIQDALPYLYPDERECLITGYLDDDWINDDSLGND